MSSQLKINGTVYLTNNNLTNTGVLTTTVNLSSSNNLANTLTITGSTWTLINQGTATDLRYIFLSNPNVSSSVLVCQNTSSVQYTTILKPSDTALIPFSGSLTLYAKATTPQDSIAYVQYISAQS